MTYSQYFLSLSNVALEILLLDVSLLDDCELAIALFFELDSDESLDAI